MKDLFFTLVEWLRKAKAGTLTDGEQEKLNEYLQNEHLRKVYSDWQNDEFVGDKLQEYTLYSSRKAYKRFVHRVAPDRLRIWLIRGGSAAAILVMVIGLAWLIGDLHQNNQPLPLAENNIILPGSNKAHIIFDDGSTMNVEGDSSQVDDRNGIRINYSGGAISYQSDRKVESQVYHQLVVPVAGECYILLDDGTRVWMNADSKLKYPIKFVEDTRTVYLEGEAYFDVKKDSKPFIVVTSFGEVNVHGTSFGVRAYQEENKVLTTLVSGKVSFTYNNESVTLSPGEQAVASAYEPLTKKKVDVDEYIGWKDGLYIFREHRLEDIMKELSRWYDVIISYQDEKLKDVSFTGNLKRYESINSFMELLQRTGDANYKIMGKTIIIHR